MFSSTVCCAALAASSADAVITALATRLFAAGHVRDSFAKAAVARERRSPTGLPFPGIAVALPHAEPEFVLAPAIAVASLVTPVRFRQMGSPATQLSVSLVVMPALTAKEQAEAGLARLVEVLQRDDVRRSLVGATSDDELEKALRAAWGA